MIPGANRTMHSVMLSFMIAKNERVQGGEWRRTYVPMGSRRRQGVVISGEKGCWCPRRVQLSQSQRRKSDRQSGGPSKSHGWTALEAGPAFENAELHAVTQCVCPKGPGKDAEGVRVKGSRPTERVKDRISRRSRGDPAA